MLRLTVVTYSLETLRRKRPEYRIGKLEDNFLLFFCKVSYGKKCEEIEILFKVLEKYSKIFNQKLSQINKTSDHIAQENVGKRRFSLYTIFCGKVFADFTPRKVP